VVKVISHNKTASPLHTDEFVREMFDNHVLAVVCLFVCKAHGIGISLPNFNTKILQPFSSCMQSQNEIDRKETK